MKKAFLVVNTLGILVFLGLFLKASYLDRLDAGLRVTELDRNQVFDGGKLQEFSSKTGNDGTDIRTDLGPWIARAALSGEIRLGWAGLSLSILNVILALLIRKPKDLRQEGDRSVPTPP